MICTAKKGKRMGERGREERRRSTVWRRVSVTDTEDKGGAGRWGREVLKGSGEA